MNESQRKKAEEWLSTYLSALCPSCDTAANFSVVEHLMTPLLVEKGNTVRVSGNVDLVPFVGVVCSHCAYTRLFSAVKMGVVEPPSAVEPS